MSESRLGFTSAEALAALEENMALLSECVQSLASID